MNIIEKNYYHRYVELYDFPDKGIKEIRLN